MKKVSWALCIGVVSLFFMFGCSDGAGGGVDENIEVVSEVEGTVRLVLAGVQLENGVNPVTGVDVVGFNEFVQTQFEPRFLTLIWK